LKLSYIEWLITVGEQRLGQNLDDRGSIPHTLRHFILPTGLKSTLGPPILL